MSFTTAQLALIKDGHALSADLSSRIKHAFGLSKRKVEPKRHHYIASPPGAGKTFTVQAIANQYKIPLLKIQGVASMSNLVTRIAVAIYSLDAGESLIVWVDDCDSIFMDRDTLNVMKGVLDEERNVLAYNKNMSMQIMQYEKSDIKGDHLKAEALRSFQQPGSVGVEVPTDQLRFIITSNKALAAPNSELRTAIKMNEAAIHDRVNYREYKLTPQKSWGWIASVLLDNDLLDITTSQKEILLKFMYANWERLSSTSMRKVQELAAMMINNPRTYRSEWNLELRDEVHA